MTAAGDLIAAMEKLHQISKRSALSVNKLILALCPDATVHYPYWREFSAILRQRTHDRLERTT